MIRTTTMTALLLLAAGTSDATGPALVHVDASEASVRADGAVAYIALVDNRPVLAWTPAERGSRRLIELPGTPDTPAWSPDGSRIAVSLEREGNADLAIVDVATGELREIVQSPDPDLHPAWSADGQRLLYTRYARDADGAQTLRLFERDLRPGGADMPLLRGAQGSYGSRSPDAGWVLFWHFAQEGNAEIAVARSDGSELRNLTDHPAFDAWPAWSPDGRHVAYARERGEQADIHVVALEDGRDCVIAAGAGRKTSPKWSADGGAVYFDHRQDGRVELRRVAIAVECGLKHR
jgi:Tol biopolymer transport system component